MSRLNHSDWEVRERTVSLLMTAHIACWSFRLTSRWLFPQVISTRHHLTPGASACFACTPQTCPQPGYRREHFSMLVPLPLLPLLCLQLMKILSGYLSSTFPLLRVQKCLQDSGTMGTLFCSAID